MNRTMLTTAALTAASMIFSAATVSADAGDRAYEIAMQQLTPQVATFAEDIQSLTNAALSKPELACSAEVRELALIGASIADDVDGATAPALVSYEHGKLVGTLHGLADAAALACEQPRSAADMVSELADEQAGYLDVIEAFTAGDALSF